MSSYDGMAPGIPQCCARTSQSKKGWGKDPQCGVWWAERPMGAQGDKEIHEAGWTIHRWVALDRDTDRFAMAKQPVAAANGPIGFGNITFCPYCGTKLPDQPPPLA